jgi:DNA-directed RNA polymerase subunit N (RpoN/RPB10)
MNEPFEIGDIITIQQLAQHDVFRELGTLINIPLQVVRLSYGTVYIRFCVYEHERAQITAHLGCARYICRLALLMPVQWTILIKNRQEEAFDHEGENNS